MKKFSLLLTLILCLCTVQVFADDEKYAKISGFDVCIDYTPISSYIIEDLTYIEVENLVNYGFTVEFDEATQSYNVSRIKFATPMYTNEMQKTETALKTDAKTESSNVRVYLDGKLANSCCVNGKTLLYFDELKKYGEVAWEDYYGRLNVYIFREEIGNSCFTSVATIEKDGKKITLQIGNNVMKIDDREVLLDVAPEIIDGRTMVPVRTVSEAFDAKVDWNNELQQVIIYTK